MTALNKFFCRAVNIIFILCAVCIAGVVFFFQHLTIPSWVRKEFLLRNVCLLAAGIALAIGLKFLLGKRTVDIRAAALIAFVIQVVVLYFYYFSSGWDAGAILSRAWIAATGGTLEAPEGYYSLNTNNIMMHLVEYGVFRLCVLCGISDYVRAYFALVVINCIVYGFVGVMAVDIVRMVSPDSSYAANICYCLYSGLILLSPWVSVVYTDGTGILFPILNIWLYLKFVSRDRRMFEEILFFAFFGMLSFICYSFKATTVVSAIAVVIAHFLHVLGRPSGKIIKSMIGFLIGMAAFAALFVMTSMGYERLYTSSGLVIDDELACPFTHYLKMGFNDYEAGTFNFEDADETAYISNYQDRYDQCLSEAKRRIKSLLPFGIFKFEARKSLVIFHDGTFSYGIEGDFYAAGAEDRVPVVSPFFKRIFWHTGDLYPYLALLQQGLWLLVVVSCIAFGFFDKKRGDVAIRITLIGIFLFLALFESEARYIYVYVPVYIVAAAIALDQVIEAVTVRWRKHFG